MDALEFDIDVDVSALVGAGLEDILVSSRHYEAALPRPDRSRHEQLARNTLLCEEIERAQWNAIAVARSERRIARRAPLLRGLRIDGGRADAYVCDISRDGLRASGRPRKGLFDVELKIPGLEFPVETRAEVVDFRDANVLPIMNLRFVGLDRQSAAGIDRYVYRKLLDR